MTVSLLYCLCESVVLFVCLLYCLCESVVLFV